MKTQSNVQRTLQALFITGISIFALEPIRRLHIFLIVSFSSFGSIKVRMSRNTYRVPTFSSVRVPFLRP